MSVYYFPFYCFVAILSWLDVADQDLKGDHLILEAEVECQPDKVSAAIIDENVLLASISPRTPGFSYKMW